MAKNFLVETSAAGGSAGDNSVVLYGVDYAHADQDHNGSRDLRRAQLVATSLDNFTDRFAAVAIPGERAHNIAKWGP